MIRALNMAQHYGSEIIYADRPSHITIKRIFKRNSLKLKIYSLINLPLMNILDKIFGKPQPLNVSDKSFDELLKDQFNGIIYDNLTLQLINIHERDLFFIYWLQKCIKETNFANKYNRPYKQVVGVFGFAHLPGVINLLTEEIPVADLLTINKFEKSDQLWLKVHGKDFRDFQNITLAEYKKEGRYLDVPEVCELCFSSIDTSKNTVLFSCSGHCIQKK